MVKGNNIIFISHIGDDKSIALKIYEELKLNGYNPWIDKYNIEVGENWQKAIKEAIELSSFFLICISKSINSKKSYLHKELRLALNDLELRPPGKVFLLPIVIDNSSIPDLQVGSIKLSDFQALRLTSFEDLKRLYGVLDKNIGDDSLFQKNKEENNPVGVKDLIKDLVSNNKVEESLDLLKSQNINIEIINASILLSSQLSRVKREYLVGIIDFSVYNIYLNKVGNSILELINEI